MLTQKKAFFAGVIFVYKATMRGFLEAIGGEVLVRAFSVVLRVSVYVRLVQSFCLGLVSPLLSSVSVTPEVFCRGGHSLKIFKVTLT